MLKEAGWDEPFALLHHFEHGDHFVLLVGDHLSAREIESVFLCLCKRILEVICLDTRVRRVVQCRH